MSSIKISNLPTLDSGTLTDDDQFVINDANQTTSRLSYGDFKTNFLTSNLTFAGSVVFTGSVTVNVDDTTSNVYTKDSVNTLISESEDRSKLLVQTNTTEITRLRAIAGAPSGGDFYPAGTFVAPASGAGNIVQAVNLVATVAHALEGDVNLNTQAISSNTSSISALSGRVGTNETDIVTLKGDVSGLKTDVSVLKTEVGDATSGILKDVADLQASVTGLEASVLDLETTLATGGDIKNEIEAADLKGANAQAFATSNNIEYRAIMGLVATEITAKVAAEVGTIDAAKLSEIIVAAIGTALTDNNHSGI